MWRTSSSFHLPSGPAPVESYTNSKLPEFCAERLTRSVDGVNDLVVNSSALLWPKSRRGQQGDKEEEEENGG